MVCLRNENDIKNKKKYKNKYNITIMGNCFVSKPKKEKPEEEG